MRLSPASAVGIGFVGFAAALAIQFTRHRYIAWSYWLAVVGVGVFGTMAADVLHVGFHVPYVASSVLYAVILARGVRDLATDGTDPFDPHDQHSEARDLLLGGGRGDVRHGHGRRGPDCVHPPPRLRVLDRLVRRTDLGTGHRLPLVRMECSVLVLVRLRRHPSHRGIVRRLGGETYRISSGLGFGDGHVALILTLVIAVLVAYLNITKRDVQVAQAHRDVQA